VGQSIGVLTAPVNAAGNKGVFADRRDRILADIRADRFLHDEMAYPENFTSPMHEKADFTLLPVLFSLGLDPLTY